MKRRAIAGVVGLVAIVSCAGPDAGVTVTTGPSATSTAPPIVTTTSPPVVTTASTLGTSTTPPTDDGPPGSMPAPADGPSGSGCSPGDAAILPEGEWFGFVTATSATGIEFDLACWFSGEAAIDAAAEDGEESPPPNDYYVRNQNTQTRSLNVSSDAQVLWYPTGDPTSEEEVSFEEWVEGVAGRGFPFGVWLDVIDGEVLGIREQWVP